MQLKRDVMSYSDQDWIQYALELARHAEHQGEVPVAAVLVKDQQVIGEGTNRPIATHDPTAHAEIVALRAAAQRLQNYRLVDTTLYVTLEPCVMCIGAILHARVKRLVFGAYDPRAGAVQSVFQLANGTPLNHSLEWQGGILAEECAALLKCFFKKRRTSLESVYSEC